MRTAPRRHVAVLLVLAAFVLAADQATKAWAVANLTEGERTPVLGDLLGVTLVRNPGAAFSIASGMTWVFTIASVVVIVVILRVAGRLGSRGWTAALGLLLGGALGNLLDRLLRTPGFPEGHVVDFIAYGDWFVGNVADIAIVTAAALVVLLGLMGVGLDGTRARHADADADADGDADADADSSATAVRTDPAAPGGPAPGVETSDGHR